MPVAQVSSFQAGFLTSLLMDTSQANTRSQIQTLLDRSTDPTQVVRVWAAINYFNLAKSHRIKEITGWHDFEVLEYLLQIQWESPRRNLDELRTARDRAAADSTRKARFTF